MRFIPLKSAISVTGHNTVSALDQWIRRFNRANPGTPVLRMSGTVDIESLKVALRTAATHKATSRHIGKAITTAGLTPATKKRRMRANASAADKRSQP